MADPREAILNQLFYLASEIPGVVEAARNAPDVPNIKRPAIIVHDGTEQLENKPDSERRSRVQLNTLRPVIAILVSIESASLGTQLNAFRALLLTSVTNDPILGGYLWPNGNVQYEG